MPDFSAEIRHCKKVNDERLVFDHFSLFNNDVFFGHIIVKAPAAGFHAGDSVDRVFAGDHFEKTA